MEFLNRSAIILRARQPYVTWANSLDDGPRYEETIAEPDAQAIFLCPDADSVADVLRFVDQRFAAFFDYMLEEWCTDPALWPKRRTRAMFREWFHRSLGLLTFRYIDALCRGGLTLNQSARVQERLRAGSQLHSGRRRDEGD